MATKSGVILTSGQTILTSVGSVGAITDVDRFLISDLILVNSGTSVRTVNLYILQNGDTVTDSKKVLVNKRLGNGETYLSLEAVGQAIENGGSIQAIVDGGSNVSISITGTEFST